MTPLRVAHLTPLYFDERSCLGGGERYPLNIARGVNLASGGEFRADLISFGDEERDLSLPGDVRLRVLPAATRAANSLDVTSWDLPRILADYDLVHIHQSYTRCAEVGLLVAKTLGKAVCMTDHGGASSTLGTEIGHLQMVDRIIAYSQFGASFYPPGQRVDIVKGGVDCSRFEPPRPRPNRDRILFVGRLLPHKGVDILIDAIPSDLPLTICGQAYRADYFETLKSLARGKNVEFVTNAADDTIRELYARAWATVLPSVYRDREGRTYDAPELMGFTLLESMSCGTPAIASRVGAMPEFVRDGIDGYVFDTGEQLTAILIKLATDPSLVETMGAEASRHVRTEFDLKVAGAKFLAIYRDVIAAKGRGVAA